MAILLPEADWEELKLGVIGDIHLVYEKNTCMLVLESFLLPQAPMNDFR